MDNPFSAKPAAPAPAAANPKESAPDAEQEVEVTLPKMGGISHHSVPGDRVSPRSTQMAQAPQHQVEPPAEADAAASAPVFEVAEETPDPFGSSEELSSPRVLFAEDKEEQVATEAPTPAQASPFAPLSAEPAAAPVETPSPAPAPPAESAPSTPASESAPTPAQPAPAQAAPAQAAPVQPATEQATPAQAAPVESPATVVTPVATAPAPAVPETAPAASVPATDQAAPAQQASPIEPAVTPAPVAVETQVAPPLLQEPEVPPAEEEPPATPFGAVEKVAEPPVVATAQVEPAVPEVVPEKAAPAPAAITPFDEPEPDGPEELINAAPVSESKHMPTRRTRKAGEKAPALTMEEVSCRTCRYLDFDGDHRGEITEGECRRKAPVPGGANEAAWPTVFWDTWCGEWEVGVSDDDMVRMARDVAEGINAKFND